MTHYTANNSDHLGTRVFLDGVEVEDVYECDDAEGWLVRARRNSDGKLMADPLTCEALTDLLYGVVTVIPPVR
ncbi:hypothetical protein T8T21_08460 [Limimaricola variabilis]|uniref:hypothetical protein n=1 Tax=Limimaricola variabilis TaxID=1492771 RepID=UPI002AC9286A|nr:hypothetical protein [Limimaricola variabilis]WPY93159.1 hypothetical protein T8T21_08460 [Limimaricola variabilis]